MLRRKLTHSQLLKLFEKLPPCLVGMEATTVWLFRKRLVKAKAIDKLFARFDAALTDRGYLAMGGQIALAIRPQSFRLITSCSISRSSVRSATIFFSRLFSSSSSRSRRISDGSSPAYFFFQLK